jgi:hypothetical protein
MKKLLFITVLLILIPGMILQAQDVQARLDEASSSYESGNLENARFALQEALNELNQVIGKEILDLLPAEMNGMAKVEESDNVTGSAGFAGLYVNRSYALDTTASSSIEIVSDSPMLASINAMMTMPAFMSSDPNQKRVKIGNYKALLTKDTDDQGMVSYDIQLPFGSSLLTFSTEGIDDEDQVIDMVNSLPIEEIVELTQ